MDDPTREFARLLTIFAFSAVVGLAVGVCRGVIQEKETTWKVILRGIVASALVAVFVGFALEDTSFSLTMKSTIIGVSAFIADDILLGVLAIAKLLGRDPFGFAARVFAAYRGQIKAEQTTPKDKE